MFSKLRAAKPAMWKASSMSFSSPKDQTAQRAMADQIPWPQKSPASCPISAVKARLRTAGLRPTRQRMALGWLLFAKGDRHVSAEMLYEEALRAREPLSLATVYNTLRQFSEAGLLRQVSVSGPKTFFDTNVSEHHHFYNEDDETVVDIPGSTIQVAGLPEAPEGMMISSVEVIVRLRRADGQEIETRTTEHRGHEGRVAAGGH
jgi:Fur family iron response transcriptional regulator